MYSFGRLGWTSSAAVWRRWRSSGVGVGGGAGAGVGASGGGVGASGAHNAAAWMGAGTTQVETRHRCFILGGAIGRPVHPPVVDGELTVVPVTTSKAKLLLQIDWR